MKTALVEWKQSIVNFNYKKSYNEIQYPTFYDLFLIHF